MSQPPLGSPGCAARIAVIGSGPSGFYAIQALFRQSEFSVEVDLFDRLPTPFGLVRGGVAPDHQNIKAVIRVYNKLAAQDNFHFFGNVKIGRDLSVEELERHYDQIVFATGNESERKLGVPGEELRGVHSATGFVGWYNGHPDFRDLEFQLEGAERVAVVGNGNVSMDVVRVLAMEPDELARTDIAAHALDVLRASTIREILILGRRGPAQAAFTPKEIKEVGSLSGADLVVEPQDMEIDELTERWLATIDSSRMRKNLDYLTEKAGTPPREGTKRIYLQLLVSPTEFVAGNGRLASVHLEKNELYESDDGTPRPRGTGIVRTEAIELAFTAVGYRGIPIPGVPFHDRRGVLDNKDGRIYDADADRIVPRQYVVGWAKRGPTGLIGSNVADAKNTVELMLEDLRTGSAPEAPERSGDAISDLLAERGTHIVDFADWQRLDDEEVARGEKTGKIREKFTRIDEMMGFLRG